MRRARPARSVPSALAAVLALVVLASSIGLTVGAGQVGPGPTESGAGTAQGETSLAYWSWSATRSSTIPTPVPAEVSATVGAPTRLPLVTRAYTLGAATAGHAAIEVVWEETTAAPRSTELVLTFTVGTAAAAVTLHAYVETRAAPPRADVLFEFYWDAGTAVPAGLTIELAESSAAACGAIGTCP